MDTVIHPHLMPHYEAWRLAAYGIAPQCKNKYVHIDKHTVTNTGIMILAWRLNLPVSICRNTAMQKL